MMGQQLSLQLIDDTADSTMTTEVELPRTIRLPSRLADANNWTNGAYLPLSNLKLMLTQPAALDGASSAMKCAVCEEPEHTLQSLRAHVSVKHLKWLPFECGYCDTFEPTAAAIEVHMGKRHPLQPVKISFSTDAAKRLQLDAILERSRRAATEPQSAAAAAIERTIGDYATPTAVTAAQGPDLNPPATEATGEQTTDAPMTTGESANWTPPGANERIGHSEMETPSSLAGGKTPWRQTRVQCRECGQTIGATKKRRHVVERHLKRATLHCLHCSYGNNRVDAVTDHVRKRHPDQDRHRFDDKRAEHSLEIARLHTQCFGTPNPSL